LSKILEIFMKYILEIFEFTPFLVKFTPFLHASDYMQIKFECVCPHPPLNSTRNASVGSVVNLQYAQRKCGVCGQSGHNSRTCPQK
jgi:hypothetical protein